MATEDAATAAEIDDIVGISEALAGLEPVKTESSDKLIDNDETESEGAKSEDSAEDAEETDEEKSDPDSRKRTKKSPRTKTRHPVRKKSRNGLIN